MKPKKTNVLFEIHELEYKDEICIKGNRPANLSDLAEIHKDSNLGFDSVWRVIDLMQENRAKKSEVADVKFISIFALTISTIGLLITILKQ